MALAALVAFCRAHDVPQIDCQQVTPHLASLGGRPVPRAEFLESLQHQVRRPPLPWTFHPVYWNQLFQPTTP
jgi:leucyl/phenylalanyl-tRNA--protein transferase